MKKKTYLVAYTFGAVIPVEASSEQEAYETVDGMETQELLDLAADGFEIQSVEKK